MSNKTNRADIEHALENVRDPCMSAAGLDLSIIDLGLLRHVQVTAGRVEVALTFTEPGCPFTHTVMDDIYRTLEALPGIREVRVQPVWSPPWTPDDMRPKARQQLNQSQQRLAEQHLLKHTVIPIQEITP